ncbi:MAG: hypothetical protein HY924_08750 [Elusimicrobia bacterium]|nr:hypothetical protein [Elusimicrobiota bacterium]
MLDQASLASLRQVFPDYVRSSDGILTPAVEVRELSKEAAIGLMAESSRRSFGILDFLTDVEFRSECVYYFSAETLRTVYELYDMDLGTPLAGTDENGQPFRMTAMVAGRGRVGLLYDRERVTYFNSRSRRKLSFRRAVHIDLSLTSDGAVKLLSRINGLSVDTGFPYGWEDVEAMRQVGGKVQSYVLGKWRSPSAVIPIAQRPAMRSDVMTARCGSGTCPLPAPEAAIGLRADFGSLETLRRLTEARAPFRGL